MTLMPSSLKLVYVVAIDATAVCAEFSVTETVADPNTWPASVYVPAARCGWLGSGSPAVNGTPHGMASGTGAGWAIDFGVRDVSRAIISRVRRPPGSVEVGHTGTDGLDEPHAGAVTNACQ